MPKELMMPMETVKNCISESLMFPNETFINIPKKTIIPIKTFTKFMLKDLQYQLRHQNCIPQGQMVQIEIFNVCLKN